MVKDETVRFYKLLYFSNGVTKVPIVDFDMVSDIAMKVS